MNKVDNWYGNMKCSRFDWNGQYPTLTNKWTICQVNTVWMSAQDITSMENIPLLTNTTSDQLVWEHRKSALKKTSLLGKRNRHKRQHKLTDWLLGGKNTLTLTSKHNTGLLWTLRRLSTRIIFCLRDQKKDTTGTETLETALVGLLAGVF